MSLHNRTGIVALAAAALVIAFAGFGCDRGSVDGPGTSTGAQDTSDAGSMTWSAHRSEALGIVLPYPEGWYVQEIPEHRSASLYAIAPPADSDEPAVVFVQKLSGSVDDFVQQLETVLEDERVRIGDVERRRLVVRTDQDELIEMYVWEVLGAVYRASGPVNDSRLEQIIERMEVSP